MVLSYLGGQSHASACQQAVRRLRGHHAELASADEVDEVLHLLLQARVLDVGCSVRVGRLVAGVGVAEGHVVGVAGVVSCGE